MAMGKYYAVKELWEYESAKPARGPWKTVIPSGRAALSKHALQDEGLLFASCRSSTARPLSISDRPAVSVQMPASSSLYKKGLGRL